jgi:hypothetical protein
MHYLAEQEKVSWTEAARVGMALLLAERGVKEYDNKLNIVRKMEQYQKLSEETLQKLAELENKK